MMEVALTNADLDCIYQTIIYSFFSSMLKNMHLNNTNFFFGMSESYNTTSFRVMGKEEQAIVRLFTEISIF